MNKYFLQISIFSIAFLSLSCSKQYKDEVQYETLGRIDIEIPKSLQNKPELVKYINAMSEITDEYALLIDQVLNDMGPLKNKKIDDLEMMDKIKFMRVSTEVGFKSMEIVSKWNDYHNQLVALNGNLTEDEALALDKVQQRFEERMRQIELKHSQYFNH